MKTIVLIFSLAIVSAFTSPQGDPNELVWSTWRRLNWDDFVKRTGPEELYKAFTYSGIRYDVTGIEGKAKFTCTPYFLKSKSWVNVAHQEAQLLIHEQGHFDITAIYAFHMASAFKPLEVEIREFKEKNLQERAIVIFDSIYSIMEQRQSDYDLATNHGINVKVQLEWNRQIAQEIDSLMQ